MSRAASAAQPLHSEEQSLAAYTAVSRMAVLALLLGMASALILASPLLVVVPLAGITTAMLALRSIAAAAGQLTGRWPAILGLCLATLFLGWGLARHTSRQLTVSEQARQVAENWLELVRDGKLEEADQLLRLPFERRRSRKSLAEYYRPGSEEARNLQAFFDHEPIRSFRAAGADVEFELDSIVSQTRNGFSDTLVLKYLYGTPGTAKKPMWIMVNRNRYDSTRGSGWHVQRADESAP